MGGVLKRNLKRGLSCCLCLALCASLAVFVSSSTAYAAADDSVPAAAQPGATSGESTVKTGNESRVIRVGYPLQKGLTELSEDGEYSGYTYEYLEQIAQYTGWAYEFVPFEGSLNEQLTASLQALKAG
ncbi:MAG: hypothetical protein RR300_06235, partial [Raoultibacter sp.]